MLGGILATFGILYLALRGRCAPAWRRWLAVAGILAGVATIFAPGPAPTLILTAGAEATVIVVR